MGLRADATFGVADTPVDAGGDVGAGAAVGAEVGVDSGAALGCECSTYDSDMDD